MLRVILTVVLLMLAAACGFGFLASTEPGTAPMWKVAYGVGGALFVGVTVLIWLPHSRRPDSNASG
jgi:hypothetical protein